MAMVSPLLLSPHSGILAPVPGAATLNYFGMEALTLAGCSAAARAISSAGSNVEALPRVGLVSSVATAAAYLTARQPNPFLNAAVFSVRMRFALSDAASDSNRRLFVGLTAGGTAIPNGNPASLTQAVGVGFNAGDAAFNIYCAGATAVTPIGTNVATSNNKVLDLCIARCASKVSPDDASIVEAMTVALYDLNLGGKVAHTFTSNIPTDLLSLGIMRSNVSVTGQIAVDLMHYSYQIKPAIVL